MEVAECSRIEGRDSRLKHLIGINWALSSEGVEKSSGGVDGSARVKKKKFYPI